VTTKKLEEKESNIIHELYEAHFGHKHVKVVEKRTEEDVTNSIETESHVLRPIGTNPLPPTKQSSVEQVKYVQYIPKKADANQPEVEPAPNTTYFNLFSPKAKDHAKKQLEPTAKLLADHA
jgi:hypothetical protein